MVVRIIQTSSIHKLGNSYVIYVTKKAKPYIEEARKQNLKAKVIIEIPIDDIEINETIAT